jgi:hypothetical protein
MLAGAEDRRHLGRILEVVRAYRKGERSLRALVADVDTLIDALAPEAQQLRARLRHHWGVIEDALAVALDRGRGELDPVLTSQIDAALSEIEAELDLMDGGSREHGDDEGW